MIKDTCICGAQFYVDFGKNHNVTERGAHLDWLRAHRVCRESKKITTRKIINGEVETHG